MGGNITSMELYPRPERLLVELRARGIADNAPVVVEMLSEIDQLHYHGTAALDIAMERAEIGSASRVLEIGSGWGGCARWIAHRTGASVTAVEMQADYDRIGRSLTARAGLDARVMHVNADFLEFQLAGPYTHVVSWLALFHIPDRPRYLGKIADALEPTGVLWAEDLYARDPVPDNERAAFNARLFPNSLVTIDEYRAGLHQVGLEIVEAEDMSQDWGHFTATRTAAFRADRAAFEHRHGSATFEALDRFYDGMASDFACGFVGGLRVLARKG